MKVTAERIPEARMVLDIEVDAEQTKKSLDQAARRLAQRYRIPGFRKGKAPRAIVERTLGADVVFEEAVERLIPSAYDEAIAEQGLEPVGAPDLEILERDPVRFKATVPLQPIVDLGDYQSISVEKPAVEISDDMIGDTILELQRQHAVLEPVERPVEWNDHIRLDVRAVADGEQILQEEGVELALREGMTVAVPGLAEQLIGLSKGPEHELTVDVPEDHHDPEVAGKTVTFLITVHDVKREILPDPDDDLAAEVGEFETFDELRSRVADDLREAAQQRADAAFHDAVLEAVLRKASVEFPPAMVDHELDHMMSDMAQRSGQDVDSYMKALGPAAAQIRDSLRGQAAERVLRSIVLSEAALAESIEAGDADIADEIDRMIGDSPQAAQLRGVFESDNSREMIRRNVITRRTLDKLGEYASTNFAAGMPPTVPPEGGEEAEPPEADDAGGEPEPAADADASDATEG